MPLENLRLSHTVLKINSAQQFEKSTAVYCRFNHTQKQDETIEPQIGTPEIRRKIPFGTHHRSITFSFPLGSLQSGNASNDPVDL